MSAIDAHQNLSCKYPATIRGSLTLASASLISLIGFCLNIVATRMFLRLRSSRPFVHLLFQLATLETFLNFTWALYQTYNLQKQLRSHFVGTQRWQLLLYRVFFYGVRVGQNALYNSKNLYVSYISIEKFLGVSMAFTHVASVKRNELVMICIIVVSFTLQLPDLLNIKENMDAEGFACDPKFENINYALYSKIAYIVDTIAPMLVILVFSTFLVIYLLIYKINLEIQLKHHQRSTLEKHPKNRFSSLPNLRRRTTTTPTASETSNTNVRATKSAGKNRAANNTQHVKANLIKSCKTVLLISFVFVLFHLPISICYLWQQFNIFYNLAVVFRTFGSLAEVFVYFFKVKMFRDMFKTA